MLALALLFRDMEVKLGRTIRRAASRLVCRLSRFAARMRALALVAVLSGCAVRLPPADVKLPSLAPLVDRHAAAVVGIGHVPPSAEAGEAEVIGSGFRIEGTNMVVTASHVVLALGGRPPLVLWQAQRWEVRIRTLDREADLAVLESEGPLQMPGLTLAASEAVQPGDWILVLGRPFGEQPTATVGVVSALPGAVLRPSRLATMLQLNAAVNAGNSGGPVIDLFGRVVGVANATIPGGQGLGFAVPASALRRLLPQQSEFTR